MSAIEVKRLVEPGFHAVGGVPGLHLRINDGDGRSWILRSTVNGKRRDIGLGGFPDVSLAAAREAARGTREQIRSGVDPVEKRKEARRQLVLDQKMGLTMAETIEQYLTSGKLDALSNVKHQAQWRSTLETYAVPLIGKKRLVDVDVADIKAVLDPIWQSKHETATRVRSRLEAVLSWASVNELRTGENPARWKGNLKELMPSFKTAAIKDHQPALRVSDAPAWYSALTQREGTAARALQFLIMTAARSGEIRKAEWSEIHFEEQMWIVPAARMKMRREHRVPLSQPALALLKDLPKMAGTDLIFPSRQLKPMSDMTIAAVMKRMHGSEVANGQLGWIDPVSKRPSVPHGLRSTFRDWVAEKTDYPGDLAEFALAHKVGSAVERAYRRSDMLAKRTKMMTDWAAYLRSQ
ncbi:tyrosine-type recombinase/integrase [Paracoccus sp. CPCC 101403]|uniref:Tyrosine-type recombinase/integrase n=1 Tax=Paracoccus broussonetiae TaxID=3075834 RepID=A0ABU3EJF0_9RHOB|nr:tyrosine-type recombinase/integrase [Paracoccus sp. CPCC 101403]MDT1064376.1 tyrosine-type recombinase/integrase [Paracoccus sp. CPCC 101403]